MMKIRLIHFICLSGLILGNVHGSGRVALVIGNNDYPEDSSFPDLKNCINDARLIARTLESVGFDVVEATNADVSMMEDALDKFEARIEKGGTALVYFAGHGIEYEGKNYLMASNARFKARSRLSREAIKAEVFAAVMVQAGAKSSFLMLDCCRELPSSAEWAGRGQKKFGLAEISIDGDILISMAAAPGKPALEPSEAGGNSPYALALAKWIPSGEGHLNLFQQVRKEVHEMTDGQQRTWENGSFLESFYFTKGERTKPVGNSSAAAGKLAAMEEEIERVKREAEKMKMASTPDSGASSALDGGSQAASAPIRPREPVTPAVFPLWEQREMTERETPVEIIPGLNLGN